MSSIQHLLKPHTRDLGGFTVRRLLPAFEKQAVGPFIFFDHMGPVTFAPGDGIDVRPHPHIGLATVTYLFEGEMLHRDSLGSEQVIRPGDVNWMTAGRGVVHSERTPLTARQNGQRLHGIQTWFALPQADEACEPAFFHHPAASLPLLTTPGLQLRIILGHAWGTQSPVTTFGDTLYAAADMLAGTRLDIPADHAERAIYVADGQISIHGEAVPTHHVAILQPGATITLQSDLDSRLLIFGGDPLDGHRHIWWNFVASSREQIEAAKQQWRDDLFPLVPGESERIPLPER
ncbi:pirin family protein [Chitinivorax sp. B]|uniref:pirin family protein n=1 Tax=Chitinivorax sp. B TaxID=2502235 RepID=UPI0010F82EC2|nr:pirin family protein [Chitinivorax sp. B]